MKIQLSHRFEDIISVDNLLEAWRDFSRGKRKRKDVQAFSFRLMDNVLSLHQDLESGAYQHGGYQAFRIVDPKHREIHKATVRDRLLHRAIYRILYPFFDRTFIADSYSCRLNKGTHKALNRLREFSYQASRNHTRTCWALKCDIKKFFANIDHAVLLGILSDHIPDARIMKLLGTIIASFSAGQSGIGLPLGNLTSQLLVNIYMNEFDQFVKHNLKEKYYIRYADDFVILSNNKGQLEKQYIVVKEFLREHLKLEMHDDKIFIKTLSSGLDFLGWVHFPDHRVLRTATKRKMMRRVGDLATSETIDSYFELLSHGNTQTLKSQVFNEHSPLFY